MTAAAIGSATISFGLVSIPIKLFTTHHRARRGLRRLHRKCGEPLKDDRHCPACGVTCERADFRLGYEFAREQFVAFDDDELRSLEAPRTDTLDILEFVPASAVNWMHIRRTQYLGPDKGGDRAFQLMSRVLEHRDRVAIGRFATRGKDHLVAIRAVPNGLVLHELFYANEVRSMSDVETGGAFEFKPIELELGTKLLEQLASEVFDPDPYRDLAIERMMTAVQEKIVGGKIGSRPSRRLATVIDLMEALRKRASANDV